MTSLQPVPAGRRSAGRHPAGPPATPTSPRRFQRRRRPARHRSTRPGSATCCHRAVPVVTPRARAVASHPTPATTGPAADDATWLSSRSRAPPSPDEPRRGVTGRVVPRGTGNSPHHQGNAVGVEMLGCLAQIHRDSLGDARRDQQDRTFARRARQRPIQNGVHRCREIDSDPLLAGEHVPCPVQGDVFEVFAPQPALMTDQQLDSRHQTQQAARPGPQPDGQVLEMGSKSGARLTPLTTRP